MQAFACTSLRDGRGCESAGIVKEDNLRRLEPRCVLSVACNGLALLDFAGMHKVLWEAGQGQGQACLPAYTLQAVSIEGGLVETAQGLAIDTLSLADWNDAPIHTLILPGAASMPGEICSDTRLLAWLERTLPAVERVVASGSAVFLLAEIGALRGKRVVAHWSLSEALRQYAPDAHIDGYSLFACDGSLWTFAGGVSAIDISLALVDIDCGRHISLRIARDLALFVRRSGEQMQLGEMLLSQMHERDTFHDLHVWVQANQAMRVTVEQMAEHVSMSARNFSRAYKRCTGRTPAKALEQYCPYVSVEPRV